MTDHTNPITRIEPFVHGLGKAILREIAEDMKAAQAEIDRINKLADVNHSIELHLRSELNRSTVQPNQAGEPVATVKRGSCDELIFTPIYDFHVTNGMELYTTQQTEAQPSMEFNNAINFALEQGLGCSDFLRAWREGDTSEWPEFSSITTINAKEQNET